MAISDGASDQTLNIDGRDRDTTGLYRVLGVEPNATQLELKRAYRRLALQYHPDRNPGTASHFVRIQHAYDVLSDERMRRIYDRYGD
ncbi:DnaJ-domain-containing protein, partial [Martensiomyces pterosporus]